MEIKDTSPRYFMLFADRIREIAGDYVPDRDVDASLALQEMREALSQAVEEHMERVIEFLPISSMADLQNERLELFKALKPFAACADEIDYNDQDRAEPTPDNEWAKFRLLVSDYRRARSALNDIFPNKQATEELAGVQTYV